MSERAPIHERPSVLRAVREAVREDVGAGDVTTEALVPAGAEVSAVIVARQELVVCGSRIAEAVFHEVDAGVQCDFIVSDGQQAAAGAHAMRITGRAGPILTGERTALNFMQRLSGTATLTRAFVEAVSGTGVRILDTRKTTPCLRILEKYAVRCGGGENHRMGLYDRVLIKDNHRRFWSGGETLRLDAAVVEARARAEGLPVEVEVENEEELENALAASPDWILLDNMGPDRLRRCVALCRGRAKLEASGGITLENVRDVAATGVDAISLGCLTHSAAAVDLSLELA